MRKLVLLMVVLVSGLFLSACGSKTQYEVKEGNTLTIGLEAAYAPFNWMTQTANEFTVPLNGQPGAYVDGYDVMVATRIAEELGLNLVIKAIEWDGLIQALLSNQIDLIIAGMSPTADRATTVNFSNEYYRSEQVIVVQKDSALTTVTSINDLSGKKAVAQLGTLQIDLIDQIPNVVKLTALESYGAITQALRSGQADLFIAELPVAQSITASNSDLTYVSFTEGNGFVVSDEDVTIAAAVRKRDTALLEAINGVLAGISVETRNAWMTAVLERQN